MKFYKRQIIFIFIGFLWLFTSQQTIFCQKTEPMKLNEIVSILKLKSQNKESADEINRQIIEEIIKRKVDLSLDEQGEKTLQKAGANELLIKAVYLNSMNKLEEQKILYKNFTDNYSGNLQQRKFALKTAKEFVRRYSEDKDVKDYIKYLVEYISISETKIERLEKSAKADARRAEQSKKYSRALNSQQWSELFKVGAEYFKENPEDVDATINLAEIGFEIAFNKSNREYLSETLFYAGKSMELLDKGISIKSQQIYYSRLKNRRDDYLGYLNYIIGYIKYFYLDQKNEAVEYFRKSLQYESRANELVRKLNVLSETQQ